MRLVLFLLNGFCLVPALTLSQPFATHLVMAPFTSAVSPVQTLGGTSVAAVHRVPAVAENPAGLAAQRRMLFFASTGGTGGSINYDEQPQSGYQTVRRNDFSVTTAAVSIPFSIKGQPLAAAVLYNRGLPPETATGGYVFPAERKLDNRLATVSGGLAATLFSTNIGIGYTRWFGDRVWHNFSFLGDVISQSVYRYRGDSFYLGCRRKLTQRVAVGGVFYLPFRLHTDHTMSYPGHQDLTPPPAAQYRQIFHGACKTGMVYHHRKITAGLTVGVQPGFKNETYQDTFRFVADYSRLLYLSVGAGYIFQVKKVLVPLYLTFEAARLPGENGRHDLLVGGPGRDENPARYTAAWGGSIVYNRYSLHFAAQWRRSGPYHYFAAPFT